MKHFHKIAELANRFEHKLAQIAATQSDTTSLFFDTEKKQIAFDAAIKNEKGKVYQLMLAYFNKKDAKGIPGQNPCSVKISAFAQDKKAWWSITTNPANLTNVLKPYVDTEYKNVIGENMATRLAKIQAAVVKGDIGSGSILVADLEFTV